MRKLDQPFMLLIAGDEGLPMLLNSNQIAVVTIGNGVTHLRMSNGQEINVTGAAADLFFALAERSVSLKGDSLTEVMRHVRKELEQKH